jgi:BlaI family transcriptional regulator, penicillinase repressor
MASIDPRELEILQILWDHGPQKPAEILDKLSTTLKNATLRWQLKTLLEKGQVTRVKKGKAYYYKAAAGRKNSFQKITRRLADVFAGGSAVALIGRMIEAEQDLSEEDIAELRRIASLASGKKESTK